MFTPDVYCCRVQFNEIKQRPASLRSSHSHSGKVSKFQRGQIKTLLAIQLQLFLYLYSTWQTLTALAVLITAVTTVVGPVTHPEVGNAAVVPTLELGG